MNKRFWKLINKLRNIEFIDCICLNLERIKHHTNMKWYGNITVKEFCEINNCDYLTVEENCKRIVSVPAYLDLCEKENYILDTPDIYYAKLNDATVIGGSKVVISKKQAVYDEWKYDAVERTLYRNNHIKKIKNGKTLLEYNNNCSCVSQAINLCGIYSNNYFHLCMDALSKYSFLQKVDINIPVIMDESAKAHVQMEQLIHTVISEREIIFVKNGDLVKVNELIQPSQVMYMPENVKNAYDFRISDYIIYEPGIINIKNSALKYTNENKNRKFFISRKNAMNKRLVNEAEAVELFIKAGFEVIYPEELSYYDQVKLFSEAVCIVGASGAAMTNLIYVRPGTVFGCIIPQKYEFYSYSTLAEIMECKTIFLDAEIIENTGNSADDIIKVDLDLCKEYINCLDKMLKGK